MFSLWFAGPLQCVKAWASVQYPLSKGSGHVAGESTWCRSADIGTPNCVAHVGEVTPSIGEPFLGTGALSTTTMGFGYFEKWLCPCLGLPGI